MNNNIDLTVINNEFDYSNIVPSVEALSYLVEYCNDLYSDFTNRVKEDEEKNRQFKEEYKEYMFKKSYKAYFEIFISEKSYNNITCHDKNEFKNAVVDGNLKKVNRVEIQLDLSFGRGKGTNITQYENSFKISFKPYEIVFAHKSNNNDPAMKQIEDNINSILKQIPAVNTIFCTKE